MDKKIKLILGIGIVLVLIVIGLSFYSGYLIGGKKVISQPQIEETRKTIELEELLDPETINWEGLIHHGIVKKIWNHSLSLEIERFNETKKETGILEVPISTEAEIVSLYILPEDAPKEQVRGGITTREGKEYLLGQKKSSFEEIKLGDGALVRLKLKSDFTIEGTFIEITPANILPAK